MLSPTNCINCGAPLIYEKNEHESTAKCKYCDTEYHIDKLGRIEEYKVKLDIFGSVHEFYISEVRLVNTFPDSCFRTLDGRLTYFSNYIERQKIEIELIEM